VQKTDMRVDTLDDLTVELQYETQHAVSRGMLRPEIVTASRQLGSTPAADSGSRSPPTKE
jgi:hypothetical protein